MVSWNKTKRVLELLLLLNCGWCGIPLVGGCVFLLVRASALVTDKLMEPSLYSSLCLYRLDLSGVVVGLLSAPKLNNSHADKMPFIVNMYHFRNLIQMWYLYFELVDVHVLPTLVCTALFWVCLYLWMDPEQKPDIYKYHEMMNLPDNYPIPFDFRNAIANCDVARKVFKEDGV
jgi:hypothetical protein